MLTTAGLIRSTTSAKLTSAGDAGDAMPAAAPIVRAAARAGALDTTGVRATPAGDDRADEERHDGGRARR